MLFPVLLKHQAQFLIVRASRDFEYSTKKILKRIKKIYILSKQTHTYTHTQSAHPGIIRSSVLKGNEV